MSRRTLAAALGAALSITTVARADQAPVVQSDDANKAAFVYEMALRSAVALGGQRLAQEALDAFPGMQLSTGDPLVRGVRLPDYGYHFDVQAPNIQSTIMIVEMLLSTRPGASGAAQPVAQGRTAAAGGLVEPDPMAVGTGGFNADAAYSAYVREALMDAMLDSSSVLPLAPGERLTITASDIDQPDNQLYRSRKLILSIHADDLIELRQGRITREQALRRIAEERF